jgi:hypothetical protein
MSDLKFTTAADYMKVDYSTRVPFTRHGGAYDLADKLTVNMIVRVNHITSRAALINLLRLKK